MTTELVETWEDFVNRRYHSWRATHPATEITRDEVAHFMKVGGSKAIRDSTELAGVVPLMKELILFYEADFD